MRGGFHNFRRRFSKRRLAAVWLCLVAMELFCPVFCDEPAAAAANLNLPDIEVSSQIRASADSTGHSIGQSYLQPIDQSQPCNDECLCHAAPIPCVIVGPKPGAHRSEPSLIGYANAFSSALPPPYLPPKFS